MFSEVKVNIFYSYSHKDQKLCEDLQKHLKPLERSNLISNWYDHKIAPGSDWNSSIEANLAKSDIILLLLSSDFLNSDYIYEHEIKKAISQHKAGASVLIPVMLRKCDIEYTELKSFQGLPKNLEPVTSKNWHNKDEAFVDVVKGLKQIINAIIDQKKRVLKDIENWQQAVSLDSLSSYASYLEDDNSDTKKYMRQAILKITEIVNTTMSVNEDLKKRNSLLYQMYETTCNVLAAVNINLYLPSSNQSSTTENPGMKELCDEINALIKIHNNISIDNKMGFV